MNLNIKSKHEGDSIYSLVLGFKSHKKRCGIEVTSHTVDVFSIEKCEIIPWSNIASISISGDSIYIKFKSGDITELFSDVEKTDEIRQVIKKCFDFLKAALLDYTHRTSSNCNVPIKLRGTSPQSPIWTPEQE